MALFVPRLMIKENRGGRDETDLSKVMNLDWWQWGIISIIIWLLFPCWIYVVFKLASLAWFRGHYETIKEMNKELNKELNKEIINGKN